MDETATRRKKIAPALYGVGWEQVPESEILTEQRAYITPGQVSLLPQNRHPKKADYILEYKKQKLAVIEAKSDEVKDAKGNYIVPSKEGPVDRFPSPQELWAMTYPEKNEWRDKLNLCALNRGGGREPRYYQEIAINKVLGAIANNQRRILLGSEKLPTLINMKYHSPIDAIRELKMQPDQIRQFFLGMQQELYNGKGVVNLTIENHYHGTIDNLTINEQQ